MKNVRKKKVADALKSWKALTSVIAQLTAEEALFGIELENEREKPRKSIITRLNQRYNGVKAEEVRRELT